MKILFAGTPEFAVEPMKKIHETFGIAAVLTQPDRPQGRKNILTPSPVKEAALSFGIPVLQPEKLKLDVGPVRDVHADLMVTCAYGQILTQEVLDLFPLGVWNIHASLLPAYRGAAPIPRAIINGERETGVTIMKTELGLDTGDMLLSERTPIEDSDTCGTLERRLSHISSDLIVKALWDIKNGAYVLKKQGEGFTCKKVERTEVDFSKSAREVSCLVRGLSPSPVAYARMGELTLNFLFAAELPCDENVPCGTVLAASPKEGLIVKCGEGAVSITELQPAGGKKMSARDFCNGRKLERGARFDQPVL